MAKHVKLQKEKLELQSADAQFCLQLAALQIDLAKVKTKHEAEAN